jgi:hypothetical protein
VQTSRDVVAVTFGLHRLEASANVPSSSHAAVIQIL